MLHRFERVNFTELKAGDSYVIPVHARDGAIEARLVLEVEGRLPMNGVALVVQGPDGNSFRTSAWGEVSAWRTVNVAF
jgi:hypothetical protein